MITWRPGLLKAPNGRGLARQLPEEHIWTAQRWVTKRGDIYRRRWNPIDKNWEWDEEPVQLSLDESSGRLGLYNPWFTSLEYAVACAWRKRAEDSSDRVKLKEGRPLQARYLKWGNEERRKESEPADVDQEVWRPLKWKIGPVTCNSSCEISNLGRLKAPSGKITKGFLFRGRRWASCKDCGLVDLGAASKTQSKHAPPLHIQTAIDALSTLHTPAELAEITGIAEKTAWSYFYSAITWMKKSLIKETWQHSLDPSLVSVLLSLRKDPVIHASLTDLLEAVRTRLPEDSEFWEGDLQFPQLRFARAAIIALY